jgi:beta-lactamase superfamily II metal-dependent hydrolase
MKPFLFLTLFLLTLSSSDNLKIYIFNVGQTDSQLLVFPSGYSILIDAGENEGDTEPTNGKYIAKRIEEILGKKTVDVLVLTHIHIDHHGGYEFGGIWYLLEKAGITFKKFISRDMGTYSGKKFSDCSDSTIDWKYMGQGSSVAANFVCYATSSKDKTKLSSIREIAQICSTEQIHPNDEGTEIQIILADAYGCKDSSGELINSCEYCVKGGANENDFSICLRVAYGDFVYSTCGDLSGNEYGFGDYYYHDIESQVADMMGEVDLYHVNHHGSKSATNPTWCKTLLPTVAVFSCGENSAAGHPAEEPLKNLNAVGTEMYLTNNCNEANTNPYGNVIHIMKGDVVISVPKNAKQFTVSKADGSSAVNYDIKVNKKERSKCKKLESENGDGERQRGGERSEEIFIIEDEESMFIDDIRRY